MSDASSPQPQVDESPKQTSELGARIVSSTVLAAVAIAATWFGGVVFLAVWTAAALAVWWEWIGIVKAVLRPVLIGIGVAAIAGMAVALAAGVAAFAIVSMVIGAAVAMAGAQNQRIWAGAGMFYAAAVLIPAVMLRDDPALGLTVIIWLFAVVWSEDTGAYFTGRYFGGPKLAPAISPGKTWSGAAGGTLAGVVAGNIVTFVAGIEWHPMHVAIAFVVVVVAQSGDLLESAIKRHFAVKDASSLVPGHGGLMDRLDGFLAAAVVALAIGMFFGGAQAPAAGLLLW